MILRIELRFLDYNYSLDCREVVEHYNFTQVGYMRDRRRFVKQILIVLNDLNEKTPKLSGIELVRNSDGVVVGYKLEIKAEPKLKLIKVKDEDD